jgi:hypothetical protein
MQSANWLRAGGVGLIVVLLAPACDDNSPMGPTAIPAGDPAAPLLAVTSPGETQQEDVITGETFTKGAQRYITFASALPNSVFWTEVLGTDSDLAIFAVPRRFR